MTSARRAALIFLLVPVTELVVFVAVASAIGFWNTVLLSLATSVAGVLILRRAGSLSMQRLRSSVASGATITAEAGAGGFFAILAGILLILPGFVTDLLALVLLLPWLRGLLGVAIVRAVAPSFRDPAVVDLDPDEWRREPTGALPRGRVGKTTD